MDVFSAGAGSGLLRQMVSMLLVFGLLGLTVWKLRRGGTGFAKPWRARRRQRSLQSVERLMLTPHHALHIVRLNGKEVVFATHPQGCVLIGEAARETGLGAGAGAAA